MKLKYEKPIEMDKDVEFHVSFFTSWALLWVAFKISQLLQLNFS